MAVASSRTDRDTKEKHANPPAKPQTAKKSNSVKVYPNPANDLVTLEYQLSSQSDVANVIVINQLGQQVYSGSLSGGEGTQSINIRSWTPGLYLYKISSENGFEASGSFIVNH